jgi:hypothetical protein
MGGRAALQITAGGQLFRNQHPTPSSSDRMPSHIHSQCRFHTGVVLSQASQFLLWQLHPVAHQTGRPDGGSGTPPQKKGRPEAKK